MFFKLFVYFIYSPYKYLYVQHLRAGSYVKELQMQQ